MASRIQVLTVFCRSRHTRAACGFTFSGESASLPWTAKALRRAETVEGQGGLCRGRWWWLQIPCEIQQVPVAAVAALARMVDPFKWRYFRGSWSAHCFGEMPFPWRRWRHNLESDET